VRYGLRVPGDDIVDMYENSRAAGFGAAGKRRILIGTYVLSAGYYDAYYVRAQKVRTLIKRDFDEAWNKVDVVLTPATPSPAFAPGEITDPVQMYLNDIFTVTVNMAGLPGISVPAGLSGDIFLGCLVDAGWPIESLRATLDALELPAGAAPFLVVKTKPVDFRTSEAGAFGSFAVTRQQIALVNRGSRPVTLALRLLAPGWRYPGRDRDVRLERGAGFDGPPLVEEQNGVWTCERTLPPDVETTDEFVLRVRRTY
jgi:hypothetical protein